jgi:hypothetical protein
LLQPPPTGTVHLFPLSSQFAVTYFSEGLLLVGARASSHAVEGFFATLTRRCLKRACSVVLARSREEPSAKNLMHLPRRSRSPVSTKSI